MSMNERRNNRRLRRIENREMKKEEKRYQYDNIECAINMQALQRAFHRTKKDVAWKASMQAFEYNFYDRVITIFQTVNEMIDDPLSFVTFTLNERGKLREINSIDVANRVIQHAISDEIIEKYIYPSLILDNTASQKGKGTHFQLNRLKKHLIDAYKYYGSNDFYVIKLDVKKYFDSISHKKTLEMFHKYFRDPILLHELQRIVDSFEGEVGIGLGSQLCQAIAIMFVSQIDHYIKEVLHVHGYGRYMDDSYLICKSLEEAEYLITEVSKKYNACDLEINTNKLKIINMKYEKFTFLKKTISISETGSVKIEGNHDSGKRLRRKMKMLNRKLMEDESYKFDIINLIKCYIGTEKSCVSKKYLQDTLLYCAEQVPSLREEILSIEI